MKSYRPSGCRDSNSRGQDLSHDAIKLPKRANATRLVKWMAKIIYFVFTLCSFALIFRAERVPPVGVDCRNHFQLCKL